MVRWNCEVENIFRKLICNYQNAHSHITARIDFPHTKETGKGVACDLKITMFSLSLENGKIYFTYIWNACAVGKWWKSANYKIITT